MSGGAGKLNECIPGQFSPTVSVSHLEILAGTHFDKLGNYDL